CLFFFFSSRRRHTRWPRDWSSDVCSSDLVDQVIGNRIVPGFLFRIGQPFSCQNALGGCGLGCVGIARKKCSSLPRLGIQRVVKRSEERRVGKECRARWWRCYVKRKEIKEE